MAKDITLARITQDLDSVAAEYASLLKQAEAEQCSISELPEASGRMVEIKEKLETLLADASELPDIEKGLEARNYAVALLNAVGSVLHS